MSCKEGFKHDVALHGLDLGEEICDVVFTFGPEHFEDTLANAIPDPMVAHVDRLGAPELHCIVGYPHCCHIVCVYMGRRLLVT